MTGGARSPGHGEGGVQGPGGGADPHSWRLNLAWQVGDRQGRWVWMQRPSWGLHRGEDMEA